MNAVGGDAVPACGDKNSNRCEELFMAQAKPTHDTFVDRTLGVGFGFVMVARLCKKFLETLLFGFKLLFERFRFLIQGPLRTNDRGALTYGALLEIFEGLFRPI
jgi:hypothetical protein